MIFRSHIIGLSIFVISSLCYAMQDEQGLSPYAILQNLQFIEDDLNNSEQTDEEDNVESAIVKILVDSNSFDFTKPWNAPDIKAGTGSGFVVRIGETLYIMTNAHVVADSAYIRVIKPNTGKKFRAKVAHIGHECDL